MIHTQTHEKLMREKETLNLKVNSCLSLYKVFQVYSCVYKRKDEKIKVNKYNMYTKLLHITKKVHITCDPYHHYLLLLYFYKGKVNT